MDMRESVMDWTACSEVEVVPGKMNGEPVIKGTRVLADTIVSNYESGVPVEEIEGNYPHIPEETIRRVLAFHERHQPVP